MNALTPIKTNQGATAMTCRVCVVADGPGTGRTLARALTGDGLSTDWATLQGLLSRGRDTVDVVVMNGHGYSGDLAKAVVDARVHIRGPVVVLTPDAQESTLIPPLAAGARGVVLRNSGTDVLKRAVHAVRDGGFFVDPILGATLADLVAVVARRQQASDLTPTELRVLQRFPRGLTNAQMAEDLGVSVNTIKTHVRHILAKLESEDRMDAIQVAKQRGLLR